MKCEKRMTISSKSATPSYVTAPEDGEFTTIVEFLIYRFPRIHESIWRDRITHGKVHFDNGDSIYSDTPYQGRRRICYYREVVQEQIIPFQEEIIFEDENIIIVDKPHFLPIHPAGKFVNETLLTRLSNKYDYQNLCAAHRLDRLTAGLVLCIKKSSVRGAYQQMFMNGEVKKTYLAIGSLPETNKSYWHIKNHLEPYNEHFRMQVTNRPPNSESIIELIENRGKKGLFKLSPITGKKHQLRVHMCTIGSGIENDPLYPTYSEIEQPDDYDSPMQLLAQKLEFTDPFSRNKMSFTSSLPLNY